MSHSGPIDLSRHVPGEKVRTPDAPPPEMFDEAKAAVARLEELYETSVRFLNDSFRDVLQSGVPDARYRAFYPEVRFATTSFASARSGTVSTP